MVSYFIKRYAMSEKGAINLKKAIISHTFVNLTKLFAPMIAFMFLFQYIGVLKGIESYNFTLFHYLILIIVMMILMFLVARWDYVRLYTNVYNESANSRIDLAERLKKLPLSYFGKRDLADLAETMMNDMNLYETIFSHAVPHIYSTAISTGVIALMLIIYNPKLAFAALWVIPISLLIIFLSRKSQKKVVQNWIDDNRKVFDDLQEKIEQIEQIKSYNLEEQMLKDFFKKLNMSTKQKTKGEIVAGTLTGIATAILKLGIISVAVVGVNMLIAGEINILVYIAFLMMTTSIYLPIEGIITFMSMIVMLDAVVGRIKEIKTMPIQEGKKQMEITNYDIEFKDVHFYKTSNVNASYTEGSTNKITEGPDNPVWLGFTIPDDVDASIFPLECKIKSTTLYAVTDGVRIETDPADDKVYYYVYTAKNAGRHSVEFKTNATVSGETANLTAEYFKDDEAKYVTDAPRKISGKVQYARNNESGINIPADSKVSYTFDGVTKTFIVGSNGSYSLNLPKETPDNAKISFSYTDANGIVNVLDDTTVGSLNGQTIVLRRNVTVISGTARYSSSSSKKGNAISSSTINYAINGVQNTTDTDYWGSYSIELPIELSDETMVKFSYRYYSDYTLEITVGSLKKNSDIKLLKR